METGASFRVAEETDRRPEQGRLAGKLVDPGKSISKVGGIAGVAAVTASTGTQSRRT